MLKCFLLHLKLIRLRINQFIYESVTSTDGVTRAITGRARCRIFHQSLPTIAKILPVIRKATFLCVNLIYANYASQILNA